MLRRYNIKIYIGYLRENALQYNFSRDLFFCLSIALICQKFYTNRKKTTRQFFLQHLSCWIYVCARDGHFSIFPVVSLIMAKNMNIHAITVRTIIFDLYRFWLSTVTDNCTIHFHRTLTLLDVVKTSKRSGDFRTFYIDIHSGLN